ncbi:ABC transporter ATP-binding protein [Roseibium sp.]|uniref:ABC transporter ATP-binding protein n=1 Tax=Roseibium sp. TaxID=1936156 RepID=UPI003D0CBEA5
MSSVTIRNAGKKYGALAVLHDIDFEIRDQEFVVLVGPSGCGKSTLLRMIAGLESISSGEVLIGDRVINNVPPKDRDIAMVFQNYALYPHMSVFDNMSFSLRLRRLPKEEIDKKVREAADILNLDKYLERSPRQLSGGQRQRVAMGRALVRDAEVFLFDEPLSNLDAKLRVVMRTEIKALHQRLRTTSVYVTHDQIEAMTMADRIVVMNAGRIEQIGTPLELYDTPANLFVADFIGSPSMNFIPGRLHQENGQTHVVCEDGTRIAVPSTDGAADGQQIVLGIRPEHLQVSDGADGYEARVDVIEPTGPNIQIYAEMAGVPICSVLSDRRVLRPGERVRMSFQPENTHLFDAESGRRI